MSSMVRKSLGTGFVILGFGVLMFVLFRFGSLRSASPQVELLISRHDELDDCDPDPQNLVVEAY